MKGNNHFKHAAVKYLKDRDFYDCEYYVTENGKEKEYKFSDIMADFVNCINTGSGGMFELAVKPNHIRYIK